MCYRPIIPPKGMSSHASIDTLGTDQRLLFGLCRLIRKVLPDVPSTTVATGVTLCGAYVIEQLVSLSLKAS